MKLGNLKFHITGNMLKIKHTTGIILTALSTSEESSVRIFFFAWVFRAHGHGWAIKQWWHSRSRKFSKCKGSKVTFCPRPSSTWVNLVDPQTLYLEKRGERVRLVKLLSCQKWNGQKMALLAEKNGMGCQFWLPKIAPPCQKWNCSIEGASFGCLVTFYNDNSV